MKPLLQTRRRGGWESGSSGQAGLRGRRLWDWLCVHVVICGENKDASKSLESIVSESMEVAICLVLRIISVIFNAPAHLGTLSNGLKPCLNIS